MKILFVCLGNICRSPIAEGVMLDLVKKAGLDWNVESASTNTFHTGEAPHKYSQQVCKEKGIDISHQKSRRFKSSDLKEFDHIYALAKDVIIDMKAIADFGMYESKVELFLETLYPNKDKSVNDPWYGGLEGYFPVFDEIEQGCKAILAKLNA